MDADETIPDTETGEERTLDDLIAELNREANRHKRARDDYNSKAELLTEKRNSLQAKARKLSAEASQLKDRRDDYNLSAREAKLKRDEWNAKVAQMRERGGLGDIGEAKAQSQNYHQKVVKFSNSGQLAHEKMHQLLDEADGLRAKAQTYHEQVSDLRKAANLEHDKYIQAVRRIGKLKDSLAN